MKIVPPNSCPTCDYPLELVNSQLYCRNTACGARLGKRLEHFCKTLGIKGLGPKALEKLNLNEVTELYFLDEDTLAEDIGSKAIATKIFDQINASRSADLATVLSAFSIPLFGNTAATKLCQVIKSVDEISAETCKLAGLGPKVTDNLLDWFHSDFQEMREFLPFSFSVSNTRPVVSASGKSVCITGKLASYKTKADASAALLEVGFLVTETVTKNTSYLIDEGDKGSTKRTKAESLGIPIISNLSQFLKENTHD
jgi:DNA ligase (NAD+)